MDIPRICVHAILATICRIKLDNSKGTDHWSVPLVIVFRLVRDVVANHKTTRYAGAATKVIQKITLLKYNVGVQAALYTKER